MDILERIEKIVKIYTEKGISLAIAESCTGGYVSHMITNISGASNIFERGIVSYSNQAKIDILNVDPKSIELKGAVSETVASQMAENIKNLADVHIGIGTTGIAGPTGDTPEKPLGLVYIGFCTKEGTIVNKHIFKVDRLVFKEKVLEEVIKLLEDVDLDKLKS